MRARARRVVGIVVLLALAGGAAGAWYVLGEARRTARVVAAVLSARLGVPITVGRAIVDGSRLRLRDVRLHPAGVWPVLVRVGEMEIGEGLLSLLAPAGRRISIVAVAVSVTLVPANRSSAEDAQAWPEALRDALLALHAWPGALAIRVDEGTLHVADRVIPFAITADKGSEALTATVVSSPENRPALTASLRTTSPAPESIRADVELVAHPERLAGLWPAMVPAPAAIELTASFDSAGAGLQISRYTVDWSGDVQLQGEGALDPRPEGWTVSGTARGRVMAGTVEGRGRYGPGTGTFDGELTATSIDARRIAHVLGWSAPPREVTARSLSAQFSGVVQGEETAATIALRARHVTALGFAMPVDATLDARLTFRGPEVRVATAQGVTLTVALEGRTAAVLKAASRSHTLWPMTVDVDVEDLRRVVAALPRGTTLEGQARFQGEVRYADGLEVRGSLEAHAPRVEVNIGAPIVLLDVRSVVPVRWRVGDDLAPGPVTVARVSGRGLAITSVRGNALLTEERGLVSDLTYGHSGGQGRGWLELGTDGRVTPLRARLEADGVDLAELVRDSGWRIARITGRVRYVAAAQYTETDGIVATIRMESERDGGEVSVDAVQRLLDTSAVQVETTGVMRQTLENLKSFPYESLHGDLRVIRGQGQLDLSLRGRKRLGIFPAAVEAINFRNVPVAVLARTFTRGDP